MTTNRQSYCVTALTQDEQFGLLFEKRLKGEESGTNGYFWLGSDLGLEPIGEIRRACGERCYEIVDDANHRTVFRVLLAYAKEVQRTNDHRCECSYVPGARDSDYPDAVSRLFERGDEKLRGFLFNSSEFKQRVIRKVYGKDVFVGQGALFRLIECRTGLHPPQEPAAFAGVYTAHEWFGGRQEELRRLGDFVATCDSGYLLVTGESGTGKTAFLANAVQSLRLRGADVIAHFISREIHDASYRFLLTHLCRRLVHFQPVQPSIPDHTWELEDLLRQLLTQPFVPHRRVTLVIDGVDELLSDRRRLQNILPRKLPEGLRIVLSAREVADVDWSTELGLQLPECRTMRLGAMSEAEVRDVLNRHSLVKTNGANEAAKRLHHVSQGEAFYLHDLLVHIQDEDGNLDSVADFPVGSSAYLQAWWTEAWAAYDPGAFVDLMSCLTVGYPRLPVEMIRKVAVTRQLRSGGLLQLLKNVRRYILGDQKQGYALSYGRLSEFVEEQLGSQLAECRDRFADACFGWQQLPDGPARDYALRYGVQHLLQANREGEAGELLLDFGWLRTKLSTVGVDALLADLAAAEGDKVRTVYDVVRLSAHALAKSPSQLAGHLLARVRDADAPRLEDLLCQARAYRGTPWLCPIRVHLTQSGGPLRRTLQEHSSFVMAVAAGRAGTRIASASKDGTVRLWDAESGLSLGIGPCDSRHADILAMLPDDAHVLVDVCEDGMRWKSPILGVVDLRSGEIIRQVHKHIARGARDATRVETLGELTEGAQHFTAAAVSRDGTFVLAAASDTEYTIDFLSLETGQPVRQLRGHRDRITSIAFVPGSQYAVSGGWDGTVIVWKLDTGQPVCVRQAHSEWINDVAVTNDGCRVLTASQDTTVKVWNLPDCQEIGVFKGHNGAIRSVAISPDDQLAVSASDDESLKVWDLVAGKVRDTLVGHTGYVTSVAILPDGRHAVSGSNDNTVRVWRIGGEATATPTRQGDRVVSMAFRLDAPTMISLSSDQTLSFWDPATGERQDRCYGYRSALGVTGDGSLIASLRADGRLQIWNPDTGETAVTLSCGGANPDKIAIAANADRALTASDGGSLTLWNLRDGSRLNAMEHRGRPISAVAISQDGCWAVSVTHTGQKGPPGLIWDLDNGCAACPFTGHGDSDDIWDVAITPDRQRFATAGGDGYINVWRMADGERLLSFRAHNDWVKSIAISPDGQRIVSVSPDWTVRVSDLTSGDELAGFMLDTQLSACAVDRDGRSIAVGDVLGQIHLFRLEGES